MENPYPNHVYIVALYYSEPESVGIDDIRIMMGLQEIKSADILKKVYAGLAKALTVQFPDILFSNACIVSLSDKLMDVVERNDRISAWSISPIRMAGILRSGMPIAETSDGLSIHLSCDVLAKCLKVTLSAKVEKGRHYTNIRELVALVCKYFSSSYPLSEGELVTLTFSGQKFDISNIHFAWKDRYSYTIPLFRNKSEKEVKHESR